MIKRHLKERIDEYMQLFPCVVLLGARQAGKTTLLSQYKGQRQSYDLEQTSDFDHISQDPELFLRSVSQDISIDEAQLLPALFPALRVAIDRDRTRVGRYLITGSSSPKLLREVSESLAGRAAVIEVSPLSFHEATGLDFQLPQLIKERASILDIAELLRYQSDFASVQTFWLKGGYPEPWVKSNERFHSLWMDQYIRTYVERDVGRLFRGIDANRFRLFTQTLASLSGRIINYSEVARSLAISQPTAREYFEIADGTFLWRNIPAFERDAVKRIIKHPRGYFRDSGLLNFLLRIAKIPELISHPSLGSLWEGFVIEEVIRGFQALGLSFDSYYYRTAAGAEVDLVLEGEFGLLPIEIKYTQSVPSRELRSIREFIKERNCRFGLVINNDEKVRLYDDTLIGIPFNML